MAAMRASKKASNLALESSSKLVTSTSPGVDFRGNIGRKGQQKSVGGEPSSRLLNRFFLDCLRILQLQNLKKNLENNYLIYL